MLFRQALRDVVPFPADFRLPWSATRIYFSVGPLNLLISPLLCQVALRARLHFASSCWSLSYIFFDRPFCAHGYILHLIFRAALLGSRLCFAGLATYLILAVLSGLILSVSPRVSVGFLSSSACAYRILSVQPLAAAVHFR